MSNIFHQSIEDILKTATAEQKILWNHVFLRFGERISVSQFYFQGTDLGTEIATYTARKLYLCYQLMINTASNNPSTPNYSFFDENNVLFFRIADTTPYWDATAAAVKRDANTITVNNFYFSRLLNSYYNQIIFIGYRINY